MKLIIEREATFENNSDRKVKVRQKKLSWAFVKKHNETRRAQQSNPLDKPSTEGSLPLKYVFMRKIFVHNS